MQSFEALVQLVEATRKDVEKTDRGNKAAGTRVRKAMQEVKKMAQEVRNEVLSLREPKEAATPPPASPPPSSVY
jgi:hypothetical protein